MTDEQKMQEELQQKFVLYQMLQNRAEELKQQLELISNKHTELETTKYALEELKKVKEDNEILIPLGSGCYTYGKVSNFKNVLVDIGSDVMTKKDVESAKSVIESKGEDIEKMVEVLQHEMVQVVTKMNELVPELQKASEEKG